MTFLGACTTRRLSNIRTWSPSRVVLFPSLGNNSLPSLPSTSTPKRHHTTIYSKLARAPRATDSEEYLRLVNKLTYALRQHSGRMHGLDIRDDDYVPLEALLSHPEFREISVPSLQKIIDMDKKHRFELMFDPSRKEGTWWIRAKTWDESYRYMRPLKAGKGPYQAVYKTTEKEWHAHISRNGIPRQHDEYIRFECSIRTDGYMDDLDPRDEIFIFIDIEKCQEKGIRFFFPTPPPQPLASPTHLLTKGDEYGFISADLFAHVERLKTKKELIWGSEDLLMRKTVPYFAPGDQERKYRKTLLKFPEWNFNGFVDLRYVRQRPAAEAIEEAREVIETA